MEVNKRASIKSIPYDEFKDNDTLEKIAQELNEGGANVVVGSLDAAINWGRSNSLWSLTFGTSCCGIEFMAVGCARYDFSRFGFEVTRNSPRQADLIMCAGTITNKMAPVFKRLYDEMAEPKYVVAVVDVPSLAVRSRRATMWFVVSASWFLWMFTSLAVLHALRLSFTV